MTLFTTNTIQDKIKIKKAFIYSIPYNLITFFATNIIKET